MEELSNGAPTTPPSRRTPRRAGSSSTKADQARSPENASTRKAEFGILSSSPSSILQRSPIPKVTYSRRDRKRLGSSPGKGNLKRRHEDIQSSSGESDDEERGAKATASSAPKALSLSTSVKKANATKARPMRALPKKVLASPSQAEQTRKVDLTIDDGLSDLSSLSELTDDEPATHTTAPHPLAGSSKQSPATVSQSTRKRGRPKKQKTDGQQRVPTAVSAAPSFPAPNHTDSWSLDRLGTYVWVLVDHRTCRVFDPEMDEDNTAEWLWWPGKVSSPKSTAATMKVHLFGDSMKSTSIKGPCEMNIRARFNSFGKPRFTTTTFVHSSLISQEADSATPRKKRRKDGKATFEGEWEAAVQEMNNDAFGNQIDADEDLPTVAEVFMNISQPSIPSSIKPGDATGSSPPREDVSSISKRSKPGRKKARGTENDDTPWEPPPPDEEITIPGELVLARLHVVENVDHWPAKVLKYVPPTNPKALPKYVVVFLDGYEKAIPRSQFYTTREEAFGTCKTGQFQSFKVHPGEETDEEERKQAVINDAERCPSPSPIIPLPPASNFCELSIRQQFVHTKPVLLAVMRDEFEPGRHRHQDYMAGGKRRQAVVEKAGSRGKIEVQDVEDMYQYIQQWCLRGRVHDAPQSQHPPADDPSGMDVDVPQPPSVVEGPIEGRVGDSSASSTHIETDSVAALDAQPPPSSAPSSPSDTVINIGAVEDDALSDLTPPPPSPREGGQQTDTSDSRPPPPIGCAEYEALDVIRKADYCLNVLLPEAVIQVLLWRNGERTSFELLSMDEEQRLYDIGLRLLEESDWVRDVARHRNFLEKLNKGAKLKRGQAENSSVAHTSRPRRNVDKPSYHE